MILKPILFSTIFLVSSAAFSATVSNVSVASETASNYDATTTTIFGAYAGNIGSCASDLSETSVCGSCDALNPCAGGTQYYQCVQRSIHPDLKLAITMTVDEVPANPTALVLFGETTGSTVTSTVSSTIEANKPFTVYIEWGDICNAGGAGTGCTGPTLEFSKDLYVGVAAGSASTHSASQKFTVKLRVVDPTSATSMVTTITQEPTSSQGFTDFKVLPGDAKAYVDDVYRGGTTSGNTAGTKWQAMRVFFGQPVSSPVTFTAATSTATGGDFCEIDYAGGSYIDLPISDKTSQESTLSTGKVTGLENDSTYLFNIATVDEATVVTGLIDPAALTGAANQFRYVTVPGEVVGLLTNKKCFIATAAYGSAMDSHVETLRQFRNQYLLSNSWGREFVKTYYRHSPPVAEFIAQNEPLRLVVRTILWPIVLFAQIATQLGFAVATMIFGFVLALPFILTLRKRRVS